MNLTSMKRGALVLAGLAGAMIGCNYTQVFELAPTDAGADASSTITGDAGPTCGGDSDPDNCGACGHSCLGGACSAGRCQPIVLASGQGHSAWRGYSEIDPLVGPDRLAVDATHVYWLNLGGELKRVPTGGGASEVVAKTAARPAWLVLAGSSVYFSTLAGDVYRVAKEPTSPPATPETFAPAKQPRRAIRLLNDNYPTELSVIGERLYWADGTGVYACPLAGCAGAPEVLNDGSDERRPMSFAIDASGMKYCASELHTSTGPSSVSIEHVMSSFREGQWLGLRGSVGYYELHGGKDEVYALATDDLAALNGVVRWTPTSVTFLASGAAVLPSPRGLALDETAVYWANATPPRIAVEERIATVVRCAKTGCASPDVLAEAQIVPRAVAVSKDAVYWTTGDGNVMKVAKPDGSSARLP